MRLLWSLNCRRALVDDNIKSVSLIDILEGIDVRPPPGEALGTIPIEFAFVTLWTRDDPVTPEPLSTQRVRVVGPDGTESKPVTVKVDLSNHRNYRNIIHFQGLQFRGSGDYSFIVDLGKEPKWVEYSRVALAVTVVADES